MGFREQVTRQLTRRERIAFWTVPMILWASLVAWTFPYATDDPVRREDALQAFYAMTYETEGAVSDDYARIADQARVALQVKERVQEFVRTYGLENRKVLDVGSGDGYLQDVVSDYTGLDIATTAARYYHKPFVAGTATAMPFADDTFDAIWSIWVLEHIPNPEAALVEMRRVVKPGGRIYLAAAWACRPWAAEGYEVRPYSDFGLKGKIIKASIAPRRTVLFGALTVLPMRILRTLAWPFGPTRLHYSRLEPNYEKYWQADGDAVNDLDAAETAMWFESRGDTCENCPRGARWPLRDDMPLIISVKK